MELKISCERKNADETGVHTTKKRLELVKSTLKCRMLEENRIPKILPVVKVEQRSLCF